MLKTLLCILTPSFATQIYAAEPLLDNVRVTAWDTSAPLPPAQHDFVAVSITSPGTAKFGDFRFNKRDRTHTELLVRGQGHAVITELK